MTRYDEYREYLFSDKWKSKKNQVIERGNRICEICEKRYIEHTHHRTYKKLYNEPLEDLLGLCWECHGNIHNHDIDEDYEFWLDGRTIPKDLIESETLLRQWYGEKRRKIDDWKPQIHLTNDPVFNEILLNSV